MVEISIKKLSTANLSQFKIDIVAKVPSGMHHLTRLKWDSGGLYDVPLTWKEGMDAHNSYEASGEMHGKMTRGRLMAYPGEMLLGKAEPKTKDKELILWQRKGQPWHSFKGVDRCSWRDKGAPGFFNIKSQAEGYPVYDCSDADYMYEIDTQSLPCEMIDIEYFLVEPGNVNALQERVKEIVDSWVWANELMTVERAELLTNLSPWLAIILFSKIMRRSESLLNAHPST